MLRARAQHDGQLAKLAQSTFACQNNATQLHQLRVYEVNRTNREPFHQRFQDHALRLMQKHNRVREHRDGALKKGSARAQRADTETSSTT